jgi:thioredoxin-related protein
MKKISSLLLSSIILLSSSGLIAQSSYYPLASGTSSYKAYAPSAGDYSAPSYSNQQINWLRSYSDAVALSQSTSKPIAILFTGTGWCPACMRLERTVLTQPDFAQAVGQKFVFLKAEFPDYSEPAVMASPYKPLLDRYGVNQFPTIVITNANGQMLYTVNYREGGPQVYAQELLQKLNQGGSMNSPQYR